MVRRKVAIDKAITEYIFKPDFTYKSKSRLMEVAVPKVDLKPQTPPQIPQLDLLDIPPQFEALPQVV